MLPPSPLAAGSGCRFRRRGGGCSGGCGCACRRRGRRTQRCSLGRRTAWWLVGGEAGPHLRHAKVWAAFLFVPSSVANAPLRMAVSCRGVHNFNGEHRTRQRGATMGSHDICPLHWGEPHHSASIGARHINPDDVPMIAEGAAAQPTFSPCCCGGRGASRPRCRCSAPCCCAVADCCCCRCWCCSCETAGGCCTGACCGARRCCGAC
jgi:hypothetical protein